MDSTAPVAWPFESKTPIFPLFDSYTRTCLTDEDDLEEDRETLCLVREIFEMRPVKEEVNLDNLAFLWFRNRETICQVLPEEMEWLGLPVDSRQNLMECYEVKIVNTKMLVDSKSSEMAVVRTFCEQETINRIVKHGSWTGTLVLSAPSSRSEVLYAWKWGIATRKHHRIYVRLCARNECFSCSTTTIQTEEDETLTSGPFSLYGKERKVPMETALESIEHEQEEQERRHESRPSRLHYYVQQPPVFDNAALEDFVFVFCGILRNWLTSICLSFHTAATKKIRSCPLNAEHVQQLFRLKLNAAYVELITNPLVDDITQLTFRHLARSVPHPTLCLLFFFNKTLSDMLKLDIFEFDELVRCLRKPRHVFKAELEKQLTDCFVLSNVKEQVKIDIQHACSVEDISRYDPEKLPFDVPSFDGQPFCGSGGRRRCQAKC